MNLRCSALITISSCSALALIAFPACEGDPDEVIVNATLEDENDPPSIVFVGPDFLGGVVSTYTSTQWYALVGDADGVGDISAVFLDIGSIDFNGVIARRDASTSPPNFCDHGPLFADNDTLDINAALPASIPGVSQIKMFHDDGGFYRTPFLEPSGSDCYGSCTPLFRLDTASATFSLTKLTCVDYRAFYTFRVSPPTLPTPTEVFITQIDITLRDVTITAYDSAGKSAAAVVPDLRVIYLMQAEEQTQP